MQTSWQAVTFSILSVCLCSCSLSSVDAQEQVASASWENRDQTREPTRFQVPAVQAEGHRRQTLPPEVIQASNFGSAPVISAGFQQPRSIEQSAMTSASSASDSSEVTPSELKMTTTGHLTADLQTSARSTKIPLPKATPKNQTTTQSSGWKTVITTASSLLVVIAIFVALATLTRRTWQPARGNLPKHVFEVLGRTSYAPRQQVLVIRFGHKILLVNHELGNVQTLSEIDQPDEVDRIVGMCEQQSSGSITASFGNVLSQVMQGKTESKVTKRSMFTRPSSIAEVRGKVA